MAATTAVVMRTLVPALYERFRRGEAEDREVIDFFRSRSSEPNESGIGTYLEAVIIVAAARIRNPGHDVEFTKPSPLLQEYRKAADKVRQGADSNDVMAGRARRVVDIIGTIEMNARRGHDEPGFMEAVRRIELLSTSLVRKEEEEGRSDDRRGD